MPISSTINMAHSLRNAFLVSMLLVGTMASAQGDLDDKDRKALREKAAATVDSTKVWTKGGIFQLNFTQVQLVNWSAVASARSAASRR
ncbi:MAG: hypothetical protein IPK99_11515 [Flavobacteriales bacterium]|nr:hypothetical protein [Flavobacteriales bacterium]